MRGIVVTFYLIILIIFTLSPLSIQGNFSEDFSGSLDGWTTYSKVDNSSTWEVQDGKLLSTGILDDYTDHNFACHITNADSDSSYWSWDLNGTDELWRLGFRISEFPTLRGDNTYFPDMPHIQIVVSSGLDPNGNPGDSEIALVKYTTAFGFQMLINMEPSNEQLRGEHSYRIEMNTTDIALYEDEDLILIHDNTVDTSSFDSICLWSEEGSQVKIDNIIVGSLDDLITTSSSTTESTTNNGTNPIESSSDNGDALFPYFVIGAGIVTVTTAAYFTDITIKKKD